MEIIAEIGQNHNGDMELACKLIESAKKNGADVVKFQIFDADSTFGKDNNPWYDYNVQTQLTKEQTKFLFDECCKHDIEFLATPFDPERVLWLEELGVKRYKIASRSINDQELINDICKTGKPVIASLGMWDGNEFPNINTTAKVSYLYCIAKYPTELVDLNFNSVDFTKYDGFSDHTIGITAPVVALSRGANIIEKHFTLDKKFYGPDHSGSMVPDELQQLHNYRMEIKSCL